MTRDHAGKHSEDWTGHDADHPDDGRLQAFLDHELPVDGLDAVERHLLHCTRCRARAAELEEYARAASGALGDLDPAGPPDTDAALWGVRRRRAARRTKRQRHRLAAAAVVLLFAGAGAAVALPGSPVRSWLAGGDEVGPTVEALEEDASGGAVSVAFREGRARVELHDLGSDVRVELRVIAGNRLQVEAPVDAVFETGPGRVRVSGGAETGRLRVEVPRDALLVELAVDGRVRATVQEGRVLVDGREVEAVSKPDGTSEATSDATSAGWIPVPRAPDAGEGGT